MAEPQAASVAWLKCIWKEMQCFWSWPFGHYWMVSIGQSKICKRCETWRAW